MRSGFRSRRLRLGAILGTSAVVVASTLVAAGTSAGAATTVALPDSVPSWATPANDAGPAVDDPIVEGQIFLNLKDAAGAEALANAVSTPGSPSFHKYLSPTAWIAKYAPSQADFQAVKDWVHANKFTLTGAPLDREYVVFRGHESAIYGALKTTAHRYRYAGTTLLAPTSAPQIPVSLAGAVLGVSIDQARTLTRPTYVKKDGASTPAASAKAKPSTVGQPIAECGPYWGSTTVDLPKAYGQTTFPVPACGYSTSQIASAYGVSKLQTSGVTGKGQTVAIVDAYSSPSIVKDTQTINLQTGTPLLKASQFKDITPSSSLWNDEALCTGPSGWQPEEAIDVQAVHGMAPDANILYSGGINCDAGLDLAVSRILDYGMANIISNSYGYLGEAVSQSVLLGEKNKELQAAGQGVGLYFSSGDDGDESLDLGYVTPDFEASSPWVTAVGGTTLGVGASDDYLFETGWGVTRDKIVPGKTTPFTYAEPLPGTDYRGGAGGGVSTKWAEPAYQKGVVPTSLSKLPDGSSGRVVPDVASDADPYTGLTIGISPITDDSTLSVGDFEQDTYGGTSLAAPLFAGQVALAQQLGGSQIGFANPLIYSIGKSVPSSFRDVQAPAGGLLVAGFTNVLNQTYLETFDRDLSLKTTKGYDMVTGIGTPTVTGLQYLGSVK